ncbi:MAG: TraB/GumN family protein [candidate division Zixibacteria bacterium]|nr:TraB/GumN family protein [candidate division Zixibacteria bacterium]
MRKIIVLLVLCLLMAVSAFCETSLWVAKTDSTVTYIGGTIHTLHQAMYGAPPL